MPDGYGAGYTCSASSKKYTSCKSGYYMYGGTGAGNSCKKCPTGYPNSDGGTGGITSCYSNTKSRAWTGSQVNGSVPSGCASVTAWNACSKPACSYVAYSNSAGTGDGTIKSGCSSNSASCTKTPKTVTASANRYVSGTSCPTCSSYSSTYTKSDGGSISSAYCYRTATKTGSQVNGSVPSGCASVTAWNACTPGTCTYKDYASATDTTCTPSNCTKTPKTVTAKENYYVSGATCPACSSYSSTYTKSDGGSITYNSCYITRSKTGSQVNGSTPSGCASVTAWNACTPGTCTYKDYLGQTGETCTPSNCTKTPKTVTAKENYYVSGATCPACSSYSSTYTKSDGGSITYNSCYITRSKKGSQVNGSTPSGCASVTAWNACTPGTCTYKDYLGQTGETCTPSNCTKTPKTVTASTDHYVSGTSCPTCPTGYPNSDGGTGGVTVCYSNTKSRAWTGSQVNGSTPSGCASVTAWNACSKSACNYVAYSNSAGTGDGTIKSGCSSNNASCTKTPKTVTASTDHYVSGTSCPTCPTGYTSANGTTGGIGSCYKSCSSYSVTNGTNIPNSTTVYYPTDCSYYTSCNGGYYLSGGSCVDCGNGYYCVAGSNKRVSCSTTVKAGSPTPNTIRSLSNGSWSDYNHAVKSSDCNCSWYLSDSTRTQYLNQGPCQNGPSEPNYTKYNWCRTGYYADNPLTFNEWYTSCSPCTNGPANSTYTSYSTPSAIYAVESNCPWQCNAGYYKSGSSCPDCTSISATDLSQSCSRNPTSTELSNAHAYAGTISGAKQQCTGKHTSGPAGATSGSQCTGCSSWGTCSGGTLTITSCSAGYYKDGNSCEKCPSGYPNSPDGNTGGITSCYSNTKSRAWTGGQTACTKPSGCASVSCKTCSGSACNYVAYSNSAGTGDGEIKSGCSTNGANCQQQLDKPTSASADHYISGLTCPACPESYPNSAGGNIGQSMCYKTCEDIDITGGTNVPTSGTAYYDNSCTYTTVCDDGYNLTGTNTCSQLCTLGVTSLRTGNGVTIPLYSSALSTPSLNIGTGGGVCYGILESGAGTLNIQYDGKTYHAVD